MYKVHYFVLCLLNITHVTSLKVKKTYVFKAPTEKKNYDPMLMKMQSQSSLGTDSLIIRWL